MNNTLKKFRQFFPLTIRGIIVSGLALFCLFSLGEGRSDLVASIMGAILIIAQLIFLLIIVPSFFLIKQRLSLENLGTPDTLISREDNELLITLGNFKVPPLFTLEISRSFNHPDKARDVKSKIATNSFLCTGSFMNKRTISNAIFFPHRGIFSQNGYMLSLSDYFNLTNISWSLSSPVNYEVFPQDKRIEPLPILLASSISGDLTSATDIRSGDLFDTKQYSAGDSLKRILWKVYARSGELIVRHPEAAIIPEGELVTYIIAFSEHDDVVSASINYLKQVESQNISFLASYYGDGGHISTDLMSAGNKSIQYPLSPSVALALKEFEIFYNAIKANNHHPVEILLFTPALNEQTNSRDELASSMVRDISGHANNLGLKVHLAEVPINSEKKNRGNLVSPFITNTENNTYQVKFT